MIIVKKTTYKRVPCWVLVCTATKKRYARYGIGDKAMAEAAAVCINDKNGESWRK